MGTLTISCAAINNIMGWCPLAISGAFAKGAGIVGLWYVRHFDIVFSHLCCGGRVILISIGYAIFMFTIVRWLLILEKINLKR